MRATIVLLLVGSAGLSACSSTTDGTGGGTPYQITVRIGGSTAHVGAVQVCAYTGKNSACGPNGGFRVGGSVMITLNGTAGESYTVEVPANQGAAAYCTVTSGASGTLGPAIADAVVTCS